MVKEDSKLDIFDIICEDSWPNNSVGNVSESIIKTIGYLKEPMANKETDYFLFTGDGTHIGENDIASKQLRKLYITTAAFCSMIGQASAYDVINKHKFHNHTPTYTGTSTCILWDSEKTSINGIKETIEDAKGKRKEQFYTKLKQFIEKKKLKDYIAIAEVKRKLEEVFNQIYLLNYTDFSIEITSLEILNLNLITENRSILMLSIPLFNNVVDLDAEEIVFSFFEKNGLVNSGAKKMPEIISYVKNGSSLF